LVVVEVAGGLMWCKQAEASITVLVIVVVGIVVPVYRWLSTILVLQFSIHCNWTRQHLPHFTGIDWYQCTKGPTVQGNAGDHEAILERYKKKVESFMMCMHRQVKPKPGGLRPIRCTTTPILLVKQAKDK
jgi:hypothetical protein